MNNHLVNKRNAPFSRLDRKGTSMRRSLSPIVTILLCAVLVSASASFSAWAKEAAHEDPHAKPASDGGEAHAAHQDHAEEAHGAGHAGAAAGRAPEAGLIDASEPKRIVQIAEAFGSTELTETSSGRPAIKGIIDGTKYGILFHQCEGETCSLLRLIAAFNSTEPSLERANKWNQQSPLGRAYAVGENRVVLEHSIYVGGGVSPQNMTSTFALWRAALHDFKRFYFHKNTAEH
ncbi:MAG: YbjN domain-containing protein [Neomegalonema sp.]|nr:YbjN domain-containing protein [Neomegalonema sp.]